LLFGVRKSKKNGNIIDNIHGQQSMGVHGERKRREKKRMTEKMLTFGKSEKRQIMTFLNRGKWPLVFFGTKIERQSVG